MTIRGALLIGLTLLVALGALQGAAALLGNSHLQRSMTDQADRLATVNHASAAQLGFERADRAAQDSRHAPDPAEARALADRFRAEAAAMRSSLDKAAALEPALVPLRNALNDLLRQTELRLPASTAGGQTSLLREDLLADRREARQREIAAAMEIVLHNSKIAEVNAAHDANQLQSAIIGLVALSTLGGLSLALLLHQRVLRPLAALTKATRRLSAGDLDHSVEGTARRDEIGGVASALEALRLGTLQARTIEEAVAVERKATEARIRRLAHHDPLTGLANRILLQEQLERALTRARNPGNGLALFCVDLDGFKAVNDTFGHAAGDTLLREVARRLRAVVREDDTVARVGGDEFIVMLCTEAAQPELAERLAAQIAGTLAELYEIGNGRQAAVTASVGAAVFSDGSDDVDSLLANADMAMYRVKQRGRNGYAFFRAEMSAELLSRRELEQDLRLALSRHQLCLAYQPQIDIRTEKVLGFEALLRWNHPKRGPVSPDVFIPIAESCGSIVSIGTWVLRAACAEAASWAKPLRIGVNVSPIQFQEGDMLAIVGAVLAETGLDPSRLELEVTEGVLIRDPSRTLEALRRIRASGVSIAMDDFGTGYSSLKTLRDFPFDRIKVDRSFVKDVATSREASEIVLAVLGLANGLGLPVIAEGVEDRAQLAILRSANCTEVQGYLFGKPSPIAAFSTTTHPLSSERLARKNALRGVPELS